MSPKSPCSRKSEKNGYTKVARAIEDFPKSRNVATIIQIMNLKNSLTVSESTFNTDKHRTALPRECTVKPIEGAHSDYVLIVCLNVILKFNVVH